MDASKYTLHIIEWDDAWYNSAEMDIAEIKHAPWRYITVGILIRSDETGVMVASDVGEDGRFRTFNFIPRGMVIKEYSLGPIRQRRKPRQRTTSPDPPSNPSS